MTWKEQDQADRLRYERQRNAAGADQAAVNPGPASVADQTLYAALGVAPDVSAADLRKAWLQLLITAHPDKGGCRERFHALQQAYAVLSDPAQRVIYDEKQGIAAAGSAAAAAAAAAAATSGGGRVVRSSGGVTVVVHGQTGPSKPPVGGAAPGAEAGACAASRGSGVAELSSRIEALAQQAQQAQQRGGPAPQDLAELYLQRARAHRAAGRLHHAFFDAQEAGGLCPGWQEGQELLQDLEQALQRVEAGGVGPRPESVGSSSSDEEDE